MIVTVFDGKTGQFKNDYITADENVNLDRSIYAFKKSSVLVPTLTRESDIKAFDIVTFDLEERRLVGRLFEPIYKDDSMLLEFTFGADYHQREVFFTERSATLTDEMWDNYEFHSVKLADTHVIVNTDLTLYNDQVIRQAMRKRYCREVADIDSTEIIPDDNVNFKFRLDDERIVGDTLEVKFVSDTVNELLLINKDDNLQQKTWYLVNGDVVDVFPTDPNFRFVNAVQLVEADEWNDVNKAIELLKKQEYNNNIKFKIEYASVDPKFNEILGLPVQLYIPVESVQVVGLNAYRVQENDVVIDTIIGAYKLSDGILDVEFGLPKTDLTSLLGGA